MGFDICNKCGACCRAIGCVHLVDNECPIYENRPTLCNIESIATEISFVTGRTVDDYYLKTADRCRELQGNESLKQFPKQVKCETWESYKSRIKSWTH